MRNKKVYYESGYKLTKKDSDWSESESDIEEFYGGKKTCIELREDLKNVLDGFKWLYLLVALSSLLSIFLIYLLLCLGAKTYQNYLRTLDITKPIKNFKRQGTWLSKSGFFQSLSVQYEWILTYWQSLWMPMPI